MMRCATISPRSFGGKFKLERSSLKFDGMEVISSPIIKPPPASLIQINRLVNQIYIYTNQLYIVKDNITSSNSDSSIQYNPFLTIFTECTVALTWSISNVFTSPDNVYK